MKTLNSALPRLFSIPRLGIFVGFAFVGPACCQTIAVGLKGGVPITDYFDTGATGSLHGGAHYSSATRRYTLGASVEWRLTNAFGFEVDAMYHRIGYTGVVTFFDSASGNFDNTTIDVKGNSWDFPVMAKYRFGRVLRPYVAEGGVLRYVGPVHGRGEETVGSFVTETSSTTAIDTSDPSDLRKRYYPGLVFAGGVEFGAGRLRVLPEFRYTRWTSNILGPLGCFASGRIRPSSFLVFYIDRAGVYGQKWRKDAV